MEFFFFLSLLLSLSIFIYLFLLQKPKTQPTNYDHHKLPLPPGTTGWPLIGETIDFNSKLKNGAPEIFLTERFKKYSSKVFKTSILGQPMAFLYGAEGNKFLFSNEQKLVEVWYPRFLDKLFVRSDSISVNDRRQLTMLRKKLAPLVKGEGLQKFVAKMDSVLKKYLQTSWDREEIKVYVEVKKCTVKLLLSFFLSVGHEYHPEKLEQLSLLLDDFTDGITSLPVNLPGTSFKRGIKASKLFYEYITDRIKERKIDLLEKVAIPTQDVMSHLLLSPDENGHFMSEHAIACAIHGMVLGGYNSLNTILIFIMKYLAELPDVYHEVLREQMEISKSTESEMLLNWDDLKEMKYSWNVAREVMRLQPLFGTFREAITDFTYAGFTIPKGWKLHWIPNATHKNPDYFPNPEKFDPSRFDGNGPSRYAFVPFGGGPRMCPGNEYSKVVMLLFMHNVVTKFKWEKLIPNEEVINGHVGKCSQGLPIRLYPHKS